MTYCGTQLQPAHSNASTHLSKGLLLDSILRLVAWLERNEYQAYDTFDGLNSKLLRPLTFNSTVLRIALQQGVRRFPVNIRPLVGVARSCSSKGMGFLARGFLRLYRTTGEDLWRDRAEMALQWLMDDQLSGYSGACWGNHFDYQSRVFYLPKGVPTVVWTALIGHAFLDGYECLHRPEYLNIASSACEHISRDLEQSHVGNGICISYIPIHNKQVHNANVLAASLLARTYLHTLTESYRELAEKAVRYTAMNQKEDSFWYYGEADNLHWVDNFHTAYVLDSFKHYIDSTADDSFVNHMMAGYRYWKATFFLSDGTPKYYNNKILPLDIQCCSQAIDTLVLFRDRDPESLDLARTIANWTIKHMQDRTGYFYYRRYAKWLVNSTPTLHWGQATMLCALAGLYEC